MYNIYRWYPHGKIIFMAPTKPLVKQQVDACYNIMAIPPEVTAELTGAKAASSRTNVWAEKRVFYITPQILQNDLNKIEELGSKIKCLIFDEAHKARGNHAYCEVIRRLVAKNHKQFRVLALSATPGSNVNDVLEVIQNLLISHLEFRTEESKDVAPYVFQRSLETVVVRLDQKLEEIKEEYLKILEYYVKTLIRFNVIQGNCASLTKGKIFMIMKEFQNRNRGASSSNYSEIMRCLNICVTLYHAFELLIRHGLRNFLSFYDEHIEKPLLRGNTQLRSILSNVRGYLGPIPNIEVLPDGTYPEIPKDIVFGHPKYYKLRDVLVSHFTQADKNSRVIVFFEYRESVMEAHTLLLQSRPLIQSRIFLGQGSGITQKVQLGVVKAFREGKCNTLLSTCIGEEGLDVGEVDLIVCFDISTKSPIRMVQRMGRTGRKREGRIVVLVTEGREQQTLKDCLIHKNNISTYVLESKQLKTGMYPDSPRLLPNHITPRCEKMYITVKKIVKKNSVKDMLRSLSNGSSEPVFSQEVNIADVPEKIPKTKMLFNKANPMQHDNGNSIFYKHIEKQRTLQKTHNVKHSQQTKILSDLLSFADSKRFNIPTQTQSLTQGNSGKNLKQGDIRNMFFKKSTQSDFQPSQASTDVLADIPTQILVKEADDQIELSDVSKVPKEVFTIVSNYLFHRMTNPPTECRHCPNGFHCEDYNMSTAPSLSTVSNIWVPSDDILDTISLSDIENFTKSLDPAYHSSETDLDESQFSKILNDMDLQMLNDVNITQLEKEDELNRNLSTEGETSFTFQAPKTFSNLMSKFGNSIFISQEASQVKKEVEEKDNTKFSEISERSLLEFFMLESLTDMFDYSTNSPNSSQNTIIYSDLDTNFNDLPISPRSPSPILSLNERIKKRKAKKAENVELPVNYRESTNDSTSNKQGSNMDLNDICDLSYFGLSNSDVEEADNNSNVLAEIDQICDLSQFGILTDDKEEVELTKKRNSEVELDFQKNVCSLNDNNDNDDFHLPTQHFLSQTSSKREGATLNTNGESNMLKDVQDSVVPPDDNDFFSPTQPFQPQEIQLKLNSEAIQDSQKTVCSWNDNNDDDFLSPTQHFPAQTSSEREHLKHSATLNTNRASNISKDVPNGVVPPYDNDFFSPTQPFQTRVIESKLETNMNIKIDQNKISRQNICLPDKNNVTTQTPPFQSEDDNKNRKIDPGFLNKKDDLSRIVEKPLQNICLLNDSDDDFLSPTQPFLSNISSRKKNSDITLNTSSSNQKTSTPKKSSCQRFQDPDTTFLNIDFEMPTQTTKSTNSITNQTEISSTDKVDSKNPHEDDEIFTMLTQPNNSNKTDWKMKQSVNTHLISTVQNEIPFIDLSTTSPPNQNEKNIQFCESQMPITQMLSYLNKSSQKENLNDSTKQSNVNRSQKADSGWLGKNKVVNRLKISSKKDTSKGTLSKPQPASCKKKVVDPYSFSKQSNNNKRDSLERETTSSDEFEDSVFVKPDVSFKKPQRKVLHRNITQRNKPAKKKKTSVFLNTEAELSENEDVAISEDEDEEDNDFYEKSFVNDETQYLDSQMHGKYLESVRSPARPGRFKIPLKPAVDISNVYSQPPPAEMDTYLEDSFCVDSETIDLTQQNELSQLEILEKKLKEKKKRKIINKNDSSKPKRRRVICFSSDDSD